MRTMARIGALVLRVWCAHAHVHVHLHLHLHVHVHVLLYVLPGNFDTIPRETADFLAKGAAWVDELRKVRHAYLHRVPCIYATQAT